MCQICQLNNLVNAVHYQLSDETVSMISMGILPMPDWNLLSWEAAEPGFKFFMNYPDNKVDVTEWFTHDGPIIPDGTEARPSDFKHSDYVSSVALSEPEWVDGGFFSRVPTEDRSEFGLESAHLDGQNVVLKSVSGETVVVSLVDLRALMALINHAAKVFTWNEISELMVVFKMLSSTTQEGRMARLASLIPRADGIGLFCQALSDLRPRAVDDLFSS